MRYGEEERGSALFILLLDIGMVGCSYNLSHNLTGTGAVGEGD